MQEILKNIIHIDKSAVNLRRNLEVQIEEKKNNINKEIEDLRKEIIEEQIIRAKENEIKEIQEVKMESQRLISDAEKSCSQMEKSFNLNKKKLAEEIFKNIIHS